MLPRVLLHVIEPAWPVNLASPRVPGGQSSAHHVDDNFTLVDGIENLHRPESAGRYHKGVKGHT